ncbi:Vacuolar membrane-associated protein iml1 [Fusarium oxysporum f. sp. albedinis]|nr:Vacuolar membrane-associated protein iml1 [Fusarium oxysporum f. sp. albedinis]
MIVHCNVNSRGQRLVQPRSKFLAEVQLSRKDVRCEAHALRIICARDRDHNICLTKRHKDGEYLGVIKSPDDYYTYSFFYHEFCKLVAAHPYKYHDIVLCLLASATIYCASTL